MKLGPFALALVATWGVAASAGASPSARLTYVRGAGAESCPDESGLRKAVAARLGYDPFFAAAPKTVVAEIRAGATPRRGFRGVVQIIDEQGIVRGERVLETASGDCAEMVRALALGISIAIDDLDAITPPAPVAPPEPAAPAPPSESEPPSTSPRAAGPPDATAERPLPERSPEPGPLRFFVLAGMRASLGLAPGPSAGVSVGAGLAGRGSSLRLEGSAELPSSDALASGGSVRTSFLAASVVPCLRFGVPVVCASATVGSFHGGAVGIASPHAESAFFAALGARGGVIVPLGARLALAPHADVAVPLLRHGIAVDGRTVFTTPPIGASLGIDLQAEFF